MCFTRIDLFKDNMEGCKSDFPEIIQGLIQTDKYLELVISDGGWKTHGGLCLLKFISSIYISSEEKRAQIEKIDLKKELKEYQNRKISNYASCWFATDSIEKESRYMWEMYANYKNEVSILLSIKWADLKNTMNQLNLNLRYGFISYTNEPIEDIFFRKDSSYEHGK